MYPELLISYLGLAAGAMIGRSTKEETKLYKKYIILSKNVVLLLFFFLFAVDIRGIEILSLLLGLIIVLFFEVKISRWYKEIVIYLVLSILIILSDISISYLLFVYGIITGSLLSNR